MKRRPHRLLTAATMLLGAVLVSAGWPDERGRSRAHAQARIEMHPPFDECDRLTPNAAALPACEAALLRHPGEGRLAFAYARALDAAGRTPEALAQYRASAASGNPAAQRVLAIALADATHGLTRDQAEALRLFRAASDRGDALAAFRLGHAHEQGALGLARDDAAAARLYRFAARSDQRDAQYRLAAMLLDGRARAEREGEAMTLLVRAADQGHEEARAALRRLGVGR